jgi:hypothetical protein
VVQTEKIISLGFIYIVVSKRDTTHGFAIGSVMMRESAPRRWMTIGAASLLKRKIG